MRSIEYQQKAIAELTQKTIDLLSHVDMANPLTKRRKIVFEAPTGAGKTVMTCQALANIVDELKEHGDCPYQEAAFIWFAPRQLHLQSYRSLREAYSETRKLTPLTYDGLDRGEGIKPGEILFVNWESVNKESNLMVRETENNDSLYEITRRTQEEAQLPIIAIIDEEHMFWSKTADRSAAVLERIDPAVELRISATPKTTKVDALVKVHREDVINAEMIKKEVILNPGISEGFSRELDLNANLLKEALTKRNQLAEAYKEMGVNINPLLLIQLPNDTSPNMTAEESYIADQMKAQLKELYGITTENGKLAVWLANEKENLANLEAPNNLAQVLLFKEAIALGWDCPRAAVLLIFRKLQSAQFTTQTVGRILRMPEQKHYRQELLNLAYVYTDIAREQIQIVAADADYIHKDTLTARRRESLSNVSLPSFYSDRPNAQRNYLGPDFKAALWKEAAEFWNVEQGKMLFTIEELNALLPEDGTLPPTDDEKVKENRAKAQAIGGKYSIDLNVKTVNVKIPANVRFQNEEQVLTVDQVRFARTAGEIDRVFMAYIATKGGNFERKGRTDKIATYLLEMLTEFFGVMDLDAKKIVLCPGNKKKFDLLLDRALARYTKVREEKAKRQATGNKRTFKEYIWEVPEERQYDVATNHVAEAGNHALQPFVELRKASNPEREFVEFLERNDQYIDWWYKNGDQGKQHFAIEYDGEGEGDKALFYVDFVIRMKNGHVYLFDTKTAGSDITAPQKHNALIEYMKKNTTEDQPLAGGILIRQGDNWLYSTLPIDNTTDTTNWDSFYPEKA